MEESVIIWLLGVALVIAEIQIQSILRDMRNLTEIHELLVKDHEMLLQNQVQIANWINNNVEMQENGNDSC